MEDLPAVIGDLEGLLIRLEILSEEQVAVQSMQDGYNVDEACGFLESFIEALKDADGDAAWRYE
jgi:hypothetical protein